MKLNQKIQAFLTKKKYKKHRLALRCMMSFMVALCVVGNLIMPAISMTLESLDPSYSLKNETITYLSSESTPPSSANSNAYNVGVVEKENEAFNVVVNETYTDVEIYNSYFGGNVESYIAGSDPIDITFTLDYLKALVESKDLASMDGSKAHLYIDIKTLLGADTTFVLNEASRTGIVTDAEYDATLPAGNFEITTDGYILITLTPEYIAQAELSLKGTLTFSGTLSRSDDASGDQTFNIGGQQVTVQFPDKKAEISNKWGTLNSDGTITWTVTINNNDKVDLSDYTFTDAMLDQATSVAFNPSDVATFDTSTKKITFDSDSANAQTIYITYTTPVTNGQLAAGSVTNTAKLVDKDNTYPSEKSGYVGFDKKPVTISKNGTQDYTSGTYGKTITWTITLTNEYGVSLDGYVLTDNMLANAIDGIVEVSPAGSIASDGTLTGVGNAENVTITYQTVATPGETYNNKVSLSYPTGAEGSDGKTPADDTEKQVTYVTESNLITLKKEYKVATENSVGVVEWTITIGNLNGLNLEGYKVTDEMIAQALADGYDVTVGTGATLNEDNEIVLNSDSKGQYSIAVTYKTKITSEDLKNGGVSNTATLKDGDTTVKDPVTPTAPLTTPHLTVNKSVSADYEKGTYGNTLEWTINIQSKYGVSLEDFIVKDAMLDNATTITISPSGKLTKNSDGVYTLTDVGDASNIQIKYTTEADGGQSYNNTADVYYPGDDPSTDNKVSSDGTSTANKTYVDEGGLYGVSKYGNVTNQEDGEINWQITITPSGGISLNGFEVYDAKFPVDAAGKPDLDQITFNPSSAKEYATAYKTDDGKLAIKFGDYKGNVTLTYKEYLADGVSGEITNSVSNNKNNTVATYPVTYTERNTLDKNLNGGNVSYDKTNAKIEKILSWTSSITYDGSLAGKTYTDTLSVNSTSSASHTITDAQLDAILIYARHYSWDSYPGTKLVAGTDYTVQNNGNTGFTITFLDTENTRNANYINISYNTTVVADAYTGSYDSSNQIAYTFGNKAQFNNNTDEDNKYVVNRQNPETHNTINLKAIKAWENADSITKPANVQMVLMHNVNNTNNTEWLPVKGSGTNYILSTYDNYSSTEGVYTITLTGTGNWWEISLNNIPQLDVFAKADGTPGEALNYRYKLAEIAPDGVTILDGNVYEYGDGYFQIIDNTNWSGVNWDNGELKITNKYYPEKSLTPRKIWEGDEGKSSQITSLTYQLQYSTDYNTWYPVKKDDTTGEYVYDANGSTAGATIVTEELAKNGENGVTIDTLDNGNKIRWTGKGWTELPGMIIIDGNVKEIYYRVREVAVDGVEIPANKQFTVSDGYYTITSEGTDTITNKFTKTVNNTISAEKLWSDETHILDGIIVQLQRKGNDTNTWEDYGESVVLNADADNSWKTSWSDLPNQSVDTETGKVVTYTYRVVEIGYVKGNEQITDVIDNNSQFAVDTDGFYEVTYSTTNDAYSYFDKNPKEFASGGSAYIKNTFTPVTVGAITPKKQWAGEETDHITSERPTAVVLSLQQKLGNGPWEETGKTVTLSSANATNEGNLEWQGDIFDNLPVEKITVNADGSFTKEYYTYRVIETAYTPNGSTTSTPIADNVIKTENGRYEVTFSEYGTGVGQTQTVTNNFKESIGIIKTIVDKNGNKLSSIDKEELVNYKYTIDGVDYYIFNWLIEFENPDKPELFRPLSDVLPEGFTLCILPNAITQGGSLYWSVKADQYTPLTNTYEKYGGDTSTTGYYKHPTMIWPSVGEYTHYGANPAKSASSISNIWELSDNPNATEGDWYFYDTANNTVYFNKPYSTDPFFVGYATKIECEKFDEIVAAGTYTVTNNATKHEIDGTPTEETAQASLKVVNKVPKDLITKTYEPTLIPGYVQFSLDINPEAKNLSSGTTIDIQDLFKTLDYFDHDYQGGQWWTGANSDKLVDIIMNSVKLYEVDANGNRVELASNKYTLILDTGDNVDGGSALLKLQIPDETHIQVDYVYKLIANENTPSVIRGCKSSTRVNGRYVTMAPGLVPPAGDKVKFTNVASLKTDSASDESAVSATEYEISSSSGTISTNALPSIKKVNTGDYTINDLDAKFLFAKYENGNWYYATEIDEKKRTATWTVSGVSGSAVPTDETLAEIHVQQAYEIALDQNTLYKLVEIKVPDDYEGSNLGFADPETEFKAMILDYLNYGRTSFNNKDYSIFLNHYISTHYFVYNSTLATYPSEVDADDVMLIKAGGDIEIPNNQLIDINVKKQWINPTADVQDSSITVELYWSYTKSSTGYPSDMRLATVEELGLMQEDFSATKTIAVSDDAAEAWTELPNGIGGKPIYYYIKETAYTIGGVTYTNDNDPENPSFKSESGDVCAFYPTYVGNAANDDETIINVNNSQQLMLKKVWKNSANEPMIVIPTDKVVVSIYGIDSDGAKTESPLFENIELSASNNWSADLTSLLATNNALYQYVAYEAEESAGTTLDDYVVSCTFNINSSTGEIVVTNKNTAPTDASVTVSKEWSDGSALHDNETIKVTLYQSDREITNLSNLSGTIAALGTPVMSKIDEDDTQEYEVFLNKDNNWTVTWTGLPLDNGDPSNPIPYYYYVLEDMSPTDTPEGFKAVSNAEKYSAKYEIADGTATRTVFEVTNTRQAIVVEKVWMDDKNNIIADSDLPSDILTNGITVEVNKQVAVIPEDGIEVVCFGDSITDGYWTNEYPTGAYPYPYQMTGILTSEEYGFKLNNLESGSYLVNNNWVTGNFIKRMGYSNRKIGTENSGDCLRGYASSVPATADVICMIGGTNDIHHSGDGFMNPEVCISRFIAWVEAVQNQVSGTDELIFVGSIPYFDFTDSSGNGTDGRDYWGNFVWEYDSVDEAEKAANDCIDEFNALIKQYAEETEGVYFVDVCEAVDKDTMLHDGCHPNNDGYKAIATAFADAIKSAYNQSSYIGEATLTAENGWKTAIDIDDTDTSVKYYITEKNVPDGWQVTYSPESITLGSSTPITITNTKHIPITSVPVIKTWALDEGDESGRDAIQLSLLRSIDRINWEEIDATLPVPVKEDDTWTFTFTNLPAEDSAGNQYYYMVEEGALPGYTVKYGTVITEAVDDGTTKALTLTNTRAISLVVKKEWSDIEENDHINDIVKLKIYRTTKTEEISTESKLILDIVSKIALGTNEAEPKTISANKPLESLEITEGAEFITAEITEDGQLEIKGVADGTAKLTVTDEDGETAEIEVSVSSYDLYLVYDNGTAGDTTDDVVTKISNGTATMPINASGYTLVVKKSDDLVDTGVEFSAINGGVTVDATSGTLTASAVGDTTVSAVIENFTLTATIVPILHNELDFAISGDTTVRTGNTIQLTASPTYGAEVKWSVDTVDNANATITQTGELEGVTAGTVVVTAQIKDSANNIREATYEVSVTDVITGTVVDDWDESREYTYVYDPAAGTITFQFTENTYDKNFALDKICSDNTLKNLIPIKYTVSVPNLSADKQIYVRGPGVSNNWQQVTSWTNNVGTFDVSSNTTKLCDFSYNNGQNIGIWSKENAPITYTIYVKTDSSGSNTGEITQQVNATLSTNSSGQPVATFAQSIGDTLYIKLTANGVSGANGCVGFSLEYNGTWYWIQYNWTYDGSSVIEIDLMSPTNVSANDTEVTDTTIISNVLSSLVSNARSCTIQKWYNSDNITVDSVYIIPTTSEANVMSLNSLSLSDAGSTEILADEGIASLAEDSRALVSNLTFVAIAGNSETEVANVDIELSGTGADKWLAEIDNLPAQDENGNTYYYWVEEVPVFSNYEVSYLFRDNDDTTSHMINATQKSDNDVDIVVRNTKQNNVTVEMPSTGGEGTTNYYIIGIIVMLIGVAGLIVFKRRQIVKR